VQPQDLRHGSAVDRSVLRFVIPGLRTPAESIP